MKRILAAISALAVVAAPMSATAFAQPPATASAKSPLEGRWKRKALEIEIAPCGDKLCGTVLKASAEDRDKAMKGSGKELIGSKILTDIVPVSPGLYRGTAFIADYNAHARTTIRMTSDSTVDIKGCILLLICRTKSWDRAR